MKHFAFIEGQIGGISIAIPSRERGALAIVANEGRVAVDAEAPLTRGADAYGEDVWS
jgi:hypothetical protein